MTCALVLATMLMTTVAGLEVSHTRQHEPDTLSDSTKAWLLMVEAGRLDDDRLRRITPKSVFIAPMLSGRAEKCKEGYRHDHLGQCVKIIRIDPNLQLELLLKRLSAMYSEVKEETKAERENVKESSGPLQFSIPIVHLETSTKRSEPPPESLAAVVPEALPRPLAMVNGLEGSGAGSGEGPFQPETTTEIAEFSGDGAWSTSTDLDETTTESSYQTETTTTEVEPETERTTEAALTTSPPEAVPQQAFWWMPQQWRVEEDPAARSTLVRFWSRFPLVRDSSFVAPPPRFTPSQPHSEPFRPSVPVPEYLGLTPPLPPSSRRGRYHHRR